LRSAAARRGRQRAEYRTSDELVAAFDESVRIGIEQAYGIRAPVAARSAAVCDIGIGGGAPVKASSSPVASGLSLC
jgi:hypothetical protein